METQKDFCGCYKNVLLDLFQLSTSKEFLSTIEKLPTTKAQSLKHRQDFCQLKSHPFCAAFFSANKIL
ncbi:CLUMA_CG014811, isoform A [Clunio marinus]|uniref:CLUMA_CG014811, isoform A n=1 Tax=Clunio marinus TaxID=568069 RepID=A0A1J1ILU0_9DIPT|nr:CLUMA_CG014811, isoform A [Clunio marinus]